MHALHERRGAVAHADDRDADLVRLVARAWTAPFLAAPLRGAVVVMGVGRQVRTFLRWSVLEVKLPRRARAAVTPGRGQLAAHVRDTLGDSDQAERRQHVDGRGRAARSRPSEAPWAKIRPIERITTRTGRVAMPTLHSTPSASARARV